MIADDFQAIGDRVFYWEAYDPSVKTNLSCCAVRAAEGLVFIDPIPLAKEALQELLSQTAEPAAVVLTSGNHQRAGVEYSERLQIPLYAHPDCLTELNLTSKHSLGAGDLVAGDLAVHEIEGAATGEIALHSTTTGLHFGDSVVHTEPYGFAPLPEKYCADYQAMLRSLQKLTALEFARVTFAHGHPLVTKARERFTAMITSAR